MFFYLKTVVDVNELFASILGTEGDIHKKIDNLNTL